ncbi:hypothetical protein D9757_014486 [Collybiopsis confluens]|uniref:Uncharacterized protein n=2 Tax=Collybiopsis confluens TaxID=2823264 RepID=A0A8H5CUS0_9AGAR|nr:hypothetical protein D9757_014486 [Collybiopsis confluens]
MEVIERPDLTGPAYQQNHHQVERQEIIEKAISAWTSRHTSEQVTNAMTASGVPAGRVVTVKDIVEGEQVQARGAIKDVWVDGNGSGRAGWNLKMTGAFPVLEGCETQPKWAGPELGHHTDKVMQAELGLSDGEVEKLWTSGIVG